MLFDERFLYRYVQVYTQKVQNIVGNGIYKKCDQLMEADDVLKSQYAFKVFTQTLLFIDDITVVVNLRPYIYILLKKVKVHHSNFILQPEKTKQHNISNHPFVCVFIYVYIYI